MSDMSAAWSMAGMSATLSGAGTEDEQAAAAIAAENTRACLVMRRV
jgi:hypothetical protein